MSDRRSKGIVDGRVAERAGQAERLRLAVRSTERHHADDSLRIDQRQRVGRIIEIDGVIRDCRQDWSRDQLHVEFEADGERRRRTDTRSDPTETRAADGLMQLERIAPEPLVAEGIASEDLPA